MDNLSPKTFAKVEFLQKEVLALNNEFRVSYFQDSKMFDKVFCFSKNSSKSELAQKIPVIPEKGILAK